MSDTKSPRWWPFYLIVALVLIAGLVCRFIYREDIMNQVISTWIVGLAGALLTGIWWLFLSRLPWRTRGLGVVAVLAVAAAASLLLRYEGLGGDFNPQFSYRFADRPVLETPATSMTAPASPSIEAPTPQPRASEDVPAEDETSEPPTAAPEATSEEPEPPSTDQSSTDQSSTEPDDAVAVAQSAPAERGWLQFRGPNRDGRAPGETVRINWQENPPEALWRRPVGPAWSSFVLWRDLVITQEQRDDREAVTAYRASDGEPVWIHLDPAAARHETFLGGIGPRATPTLADGGLFTLGATGVLNRLDPQTGTVTWSRDMAADAGTEQLEFGFAGSPLVHDGLVIVNPGLNVPLDGEPSLYDGKPDGAVIAYDAESGDIVWRSSRRKAGYTAPRLETIDGVPQVLVYMAWGLASHDPRSGAELWWHDFKNPYGTNSVQPILTGEGHVFISTEATGSALLDPRREGETWTVDLRWQRDNRFKLRFNGGVLDGDTVYGLDGGILSAFDVVEGKRLWKKGRYRFGQLLLLDNVLLVAAEDGDVVAVDASRDGMEELSRFHAVDGRCWNHPAVFEGRLYVRSDQEMAAFDLRPDRQTSRR